MASELNVGPSQKKSKSAFNRTVCVFCAEPFKKSPSVTPDISKLDSLFGACRERLDDIARKLLEHEDQILKGEVSFCYHRNCRATYCSSLHVKRAVEKRKASVSVDVSGGASGVSGGGLTYSEHEHAEAETTRLTRAATGETLFDWKGNCFICGEICHAKQRGSWSMVESSVAGDPSRHLMYTKILTAAQERNDIQMITRLRGVINGDLVAAEARYHRKRNCVSSYLNIRNIAASRRLSTTKEDNIHSRAIQQLIIEFRPKIETKQVFLLSTLRTYYRQLIEDTDESSTYTSQNLKLKLQKEWPTLAFIHQRGDSDLVCSNTISVGEALLKANHISRQLLSAEVESLGPDADKDACTLSEEAIVHHAVGILRKRMALTNQLDGEYFSPQETGLDEQRAFVDPLVYKAIGWMTNAKLYERGEDIQTDARCLSIACDITTLSTSITSPKHLGLAVSLHHNFGSRKLIDTISALGYCVSYTELRRFHTSAAIYVDAQQQPSEISAFIPLDLSPANNGGQLILSAADNWDHNERTIDGKSTTHAMTSILIQPITTTDQMFRRIKRESSRTLDISTLQCE